MLRVKQASARAGPAEARASSSLRFVPRPSAHGSRISPSSFAPSVISPVSRAPITSLVNLRPINSCRRRGTSLRPLASSAPYPFHRREYHRLRFCPSPYGPVSVYQDPRQPDIFNAVLGFQRDDEPAGPNPIILEIFLSGDSAINIYSLLCQHPMDRPMTHDFMYTILQQSNSKVKLLWVAITELHDDIFIARAFFGDPATGRVEWDCDCRPSDGCFLAIKSKAPLFVHSKVWAEASKAVQDSTIHRLISEDAGRQASSSHVPTQQQASNDERTQSNPQQQHAAAAQAAIPHEIASIGLPSHDDFTLLREDDMDEIKLLKQKLVVAVKMEDYDLCARLRDHPWMQLYKEAQVYKAMGRYEDAGIFEALLKREVENNNAACSRD